MPQNTPDLTAAGVVAIISFAVVAAIVVLFMVWLREGRDDGRQAAQDPCEGAMRELALETGQESQETGYLTPAQAEAFISLLEAEPEPMVQWHCPLCIMELCDEQGIPLATVRTAGSRRYCAQHRHSILARATRARQGA